MKIAIHTLKGLSKSIGATLLHNICNELEETQNKALYDTLYLELKRVTNEISSQIQKKSVESLPKITDELRNHLFSNLKEGIVKKRSILTLPIIEELQCYNLSKQDSNLVDIIAELLKNREFKKALEMFDEK